MRAADPGYITHEDDCNRGDVIVPVSDVTELICLKEKVSRKLDKEVSTVWLTTAERGFSLTDEDHMVVGHKDIREEQTTDRYLAPAILKFAINVQRGRAPTNIEPRREREPRREIVALHRMG